MPIYDFKCIKCSHVQERFEKMETKVRCPLCFHPMIRLMGAAAIVNRVNLRIPLNGSSMRKKIK